jgi:hypothetical protein
MPALDFAIICGVDTAGEDKEVVQLNGKHRETSK